MVCDTALIKAAKVNVHAGRGVRVVGRLACSEEDNSLYIKAEHVEYRPELGGKKQKN
jgi:hypothetical protein